MIATTRPILRIVVLAAGFSIRLGQPKALARIHGASLLNRTLALLAPLAASTEIIVVIPPGSRRYRLACTARSVDFIANPQRATGLSSSVRRGLNRARYSAAVMLLPVDLARLERRDIARLISRWRGARRKVVAARIRGRAGIPLIVPRSLYPRALLVTGDQGLRDLVRRLPAENVSLVDLAGAQFDVDTAQDLSRARRRVRPGRTRF